MATDPSSSPQHLLPGGEHSSSGPAEPAAPAVGLPSRHLQNMPPDELRALAEEFGLESHRYPTPQHLVAALHQRRQLIAAMDRHVMLEVIKWGRRPVPLNASHEQLAQEIVRISSMNFSGLSRPGLAVLAILRNVDVRPDDDIRGLVGKLKRREGLFAKLNRKRRSMVGSMVSKLIGEEQPSDYQFLPPQQPGGAAGGSAASAPPPRATSIKEQIEESGLFGGIAGRIKRSADSYINQKLDEVETRIDRKLDEIDRRLAEWRDKEIANRIRILKITLWASVIVAAVSLLYSYAAYLWALVTKGGPG